MHPAAGEYSLPHSCTFVAPRGVVRAVQKFIAHPEQLKEVFVDRWDADIAKRLVDNQNIR